MSQRTMKGSLADRRRPAWFVFSACAVAAWTAAAAAIAAEPAALSPQARAVLQRACTSCHGKELAEAGVNLEQLLAAEELGRGFKSWEKVVRMLRERKMPPEDAPQPEAAERAATIAAIEQALNAYVKRHAGDPGPVVIRRLTSAEYGYTIRDLTGLDLNLERSFVSDAVGGEGFTNVGAAQFMQDSTLERYLEAAKKVSEHAVIGARPFLEFDRDPGLTGRELSAIRRIQQIYRAHGFRTAAGEGAEPFGLDQYPRAFFVAWQFRHRTQLQRGDLPLPQLAREEGLSVPFCEHVWQVLQSADTAFPLSVIVAGWQALPQPGAAEQIAAPTRAECEKLGRLLRELQSMLAAAAGDEEEAAVLTAGVVNVRPSHSFTADIDWATGSAEAEFELSVTSASKDPAAGAIVRWRNPRLRFRHQDNRQGEYVPLATQLLPESVDRLRFGRHPAGAAIGEHDFVFAGETAAAVKLRVPDGTVAAQLRVDVELDLKHGADSIVRCRIADGAVAGETAAEVGASSALLANPASAAVAEWQVGVSQFALALPEVSHREPAPSDRDPIPAPFDGAYNMPERNHFHTAIKYHRDDRFLVEKMLDDATQQQLDHAWTDLLTSFEYHDANLRFAAKKFAVDPGAATIAELDPNAIERLPPEPRGYIRRLFDEQRAMQQALLAAEEGHLHDTLRLAELAWRRPLHDQESRRLREFYQLLRRKDKLDHTKALRALLTRILVAPAFLYRAEPPIAESPVSDPPLAESADTQFEVVPLTDWELASRLSYFLWSSMPDEELRRLAASGQLREPEQLAAQARRMLRDPKARRFASEFFGQWFGFYRFDDYHGVDTGRFPEFTDRLKTAMYDEAVSFFEYLVREDRPVRDILFADYSFLNRDLAKHYGIETNVELTDRPTLVPGLGGSHRGGLLGLGAVLTVTSAPLRTSPVKRGDWILRRVLGTPVPPPPADAGSIPPDDVLTDGRTVRDRLEAHRHKAACANCHARIDPLGFALEPFDTIGGWRSQYRDGQEIDSSGTLHDGAKVAGPDGLRQYLRSRETDIQRTLCTKVLGYALGRSEWITDRDLTQQMMAGLAADNRFSTTIIRTVTSPAFCQKRTR